jgi:hypothetical protein
MISKIPTNPVADKIFRNLKTGGPYSSPINTYLGAPARREAFLFKT